MATLNEQGRTDPSVPVTPELEQRLHDHFRVAHNPEAAPDLLWQRLAPQLGGSPSPTLGQRGQHGVRLLFRGLAGTPSRRRILGMSAAAVLALAIGGATFPLWDRPAPAGAEAQAIVAKAESVSTAPLVPSYHLRAVTSQGKQSESVEEWRVGKGRWRTETTLRDPSGALLSLVGTAQNGVRQWAFSTVKGQTHVAVWDLSAELPGNDGSSSASAGAEKSPDANQLQLANQQKRQAEAAMLAKQQAGATASSSVSSAVASKQALMDDAKKRLAAAGASVQQDASASSVGALGAMSPQDRRLADEKQRLAAAGSARQDAATSESATPAGMSPQDQQLLDQKKRLAAAGSASSAGSTASQPFAFGPDSLVGFMKAVSMKLCGTPQQQGSETIAGRDAYKIVIVPDANGCPDGRGAPPVGRTIFWLDKQTYMQLKWEQYAPEGTLQARYEVTSLQYDVPIPDSTFTYTPPPGATVLTVTPQTGKQDIAAFLNLGTGTDGMGKP